MTLYDLAYWTGLVAASPYWLIKPTVRRKVLGALATRGREACPTPAPRVDVMIHAVSVGEVSATRELVAGLRQANPSWQFAVSVTTQTGFDQAKKIYGEADDVTLLRYPLDFSGPVRRTLDVLKPRIVVLMELEVWPNFLRECGRRGIPVVLINGRMTPHSYRRYKAFAWLVRPMFRRLSAVCAQEEVYRQRFVELGVFPDRASVTGTMKFDTAVVQESVPGAFELAKNVGLRPEDPIWVCGSTGPGEEAIVLSEYAALREKFAKLRLVIVPRKPERFDEVAGLIGASGFALTRRSVESPNPAPDAVVLGDTMGELRKFYSLASVVFVGRTLVDLGSRQHGSDMIEPAALGKPVIVGQFTGNFAEPMNRLSERDAVATVKTGAELREQISAWLRDPALAKAQGTRARWVVIENKGATGRHQQTIERLLKS